MADAVVATKIAVLVLFFVVTMLCGLLPMLLVRLARSWTKRFEAGRASKLVSGLRSHGDLVVSCIMCLGAGVLLATIFTHMIPEVREVFAKIDEAELFPDIGLPPGELFLCAGFFMVFFIEEVAHTFMAHGHRRKHQRSTADAAEAGDKEAVTEDSTAGSEEPVHGHDHGVDIASLHAFRAYLIVIALSVHSVFEGFAAAFEDSAREVWIFFAAIMAHKAIVAFCIGEQLLNTKRSVCFIVSNLSIFSLATPLGVLLGLVVANSEQQGGGSLLATGILQGLAAGTILYVIFFELLGPEQRKPGPGLVKFFAMLVGFVLMLIIHSTGGHSHSHGGHSHALGAHGQGAPENHATMHHGHDHGDHGDQHDDVARRVGDAIHTHDHDLPEGQSEHPEHRDHHDHANDSQHGHEDHHDHAHDLTRDHGHYHAQRSDHAVPSDPSETSDHSHHANYDHLDHSDHDHHDHSDNHDHSMHPDHSDHPKSDKPAASGTGPTDVTYDVFGPEGATEATVDVRAVPDRSHSLSVNDSKIGDEKHHFHADGHDHLGPATGDNVGHGLGADSGHDHSDHAGHDHNHADHAGHDHPEHPGHYLMKHNMQNNTDSSGHNHSDQVAHDHSGDSDHDHSDHSDHHPRMSPDGADRGMHAPHGHLDHATEHEATVETPSLKNRTEMIGIIDNPQVNRTGRNSAAVGAADHGQSHEVTKGHELSLEGSGMTGQLDTAAGEVVVEHEHGDIPQW